MAFGLFFASYVLFPQRWLAEWRCLGGSSQEGGSRVPVCDVRGARLWTLDAILHRRLKIYYAIISSQSVFILVLIVYLLFASSAYFRILFSSLIFSFCSHATANLYLFSISTTL